jgi:hypothetical protein
MLLEILCFGLFSLLFSFQVSANQLTSDQLRTIQYVVGDLIETTHPSLNVKDLQIEYYTIKKDDYYFVSNFGAGRVLLGNNHYKLGVNPLVFKNNITADALKGVLAHELRHTEDYISGSTLGTLLPIGLQIMVKESRIQYERKTDLKVVLKGLSKELIAYKKWQYPLLAKKTLDIKKQEYLTPKEINMIVENKDEYPEMIQSWFDYQIPLNSIDLLFDLKKYRKQLNLSYITAKVSRRTRHSISRGLKNRELSIKITSRDFSYKKCLLDVYLKGRKNQYYFNNKRTYKIKSFKNNESIKINLNVLSKVVSADFRLYNCKDMEGDGIFFAAE